MEDRDWSQSLRVRIKQQGLRVKAVPLARLERAVHLIQVQGTSLKPRDKNVPDASSAVDDRIKLYLSGRLTVFALILDINKNLCSVFSEHRKIDAIRRDGGSKRHRISRERLY